MTISKNLTFSFNHSDQIDKIYETMTSTQIKQAFDSRGVDIKTFIYSIIDILASTEGAKSIGYDTRTVSQALDDIRASMENLIDNKIGINDSIISTEKTWSSSKIDNDKQNKVDNTLETISKVVVGAINELNSLKQSKSDSTLTTTNKTIVGAINEHTLSLSGKVNKTIQQITPTLLNGWTNFGNGYDDIKYWKDDLGMVHIQGAITGGTANAMFILPAGYRPSGFLLVTVASVNSSSGWDDFQVMIRPNGSVEVNTGIVGKTHVFSASFLAA